MFPSKAKILFQLSGSIAAYKACEVISSLKKGGHDVRCAASASALRFVGAATLEGLTGYPVFTDAFETGRAMDHIELERWADLIVLCPASASMINKLSAGIGEDAISTLFLAHEFKKPYLVAPAMNHAMYLHPTTQASLTRLREWGVQIIEPESGALACGENGTGRLASPEKILKTIAAVLKKTPGGTGKDILITFGGTEESIDEVRTLANFSRGHTGALLADFLAENGHRVTAVVSEKAVRSRHHDRLYTYRSFFDLDSLLQKILAEKNFDAIVHLAAVSDFSVESVEVNGARKNTVTEKLRSSDRISIHLKPNFKIVERLKQYSKNKDILVVAFKLTRTPDLEKRKEDVLKLSLSPGVDYVVHNDYSEIDERRHKFRIYQGSLPLAQGESKKELAEVLEKLLFQAFDNPNTNRTEKNNDLMS